MNATKTRGSGKTTVGTAAQRAKEARRETERKLDKAKASQITTQQQQPVSLCKEVGRYPEPTTIKTLAYDVAVIGNPLSAIVQSCIVEVANQKPFSMPDSHKTKDTINVLNLSYYFHWLAFSHLKRVRAVLGPGANDVNYVEPARDLPLPHGLAKFLEYYGPFLDKNTGCTFQRQVKWKAWPAVNNTYELGITVANGDSWFSSSTQRSFFQWGLVKGECAHPHTMFSGTMGLADMDTLAGDISQYLSGCSGMCKLSDIPPVAPDASASAVVGSNYVLCPSSKFAADVAESICPVDTTNCSALWFSKPRIVDVYFAGSGDTNNAALATSGPGVAWDKWVYILNRCPWSGGKIKKMLAQFPLAPLHSLKLTIMPVNFAIFNSILGATIQAQAQEPGITYTADDLWFFACLCKQVLFARLAATSWLGCWTSQSVTYSVALVEADPMLLTVPLPPLIASYISGVGPVVCAGELYVPHSNVQFPFFYGSANAGIHDAMCVVSSVVTSGTTTYTPTIAGLTVNTTGENSTYRPVTSFATTDQVIAKFRNSQLNLKYSKTSCPVSQYALGCCQMVLTLMTDQNWGVSGDTFTFGTESDFENKFVPEYIGAYAPVRLSVAENMKAPYSAISLAWSYDTNIVLPDTQYGPNVFSYSEGYFPVYDTNVLFTTDGFISAFGVARGEGLAYQDRDPLKLIRRALNDQIANIPASDPGSGSVWSPWNWPHVGDAMRFAWNSPMISKYRKIYEEKGLTEAWKKGFQDVNGAYMTASELYAMIRQLSGGGGYLPLIEAAPYVRVEEID